MSSLIALISTVLAVALALVIAWRCIRGNTVAWFNDWASGVQSLTVSAAVIVGGVWTLHTFISSQQTRKAQADLDTIAHNRQAVDIHLATTVTSGTLPGHYGVIVAATLHNRGIRYVPFALRNDAFELGRATSTAAGVRAASVSRAPAFAYLIPDGQKFLSELLVQPGTEESITSYFEVAVPGVYLCTVSLRPLDAADIAPGAPIRLIGTAFVEVPPLDPTRTNTKSATSHSEGRQPRSKS